MGWDIFRKRVIRAMNRPPKNTDEIAKVIAQSYDFIVRTPEVLDKQITGDLVNKHTLQSGNKELLETWISNQFRLQSKSIISLGLPTLIAKGFPKYWTGGRMKPGPPPSIFPLGNISQMTVTNPGIIIPKLLPNPKSSEEFVEQIIILGKKHLLTVSGQKIIDVITPPFGAIVPTPIPWVGYKIIDEIDET